MEERLFFEVKLLNSSIVNQLKLLEKEGYIEVVEFFAKASEKSFKQARSEECTHIKESSL